jgi:hypothetical protein
MSTSDPLVPAEVDLTDFPFMPIMIARLKQSRAWLACKRKPELAFYMLNLWTASWHARPASSLENDDDVLADLAMCAPQAWKKVKADVMRGWVSCSDGRLYHPVVAERALDAWMQRLNSRRLSAAGNAKRHKLAFDPKPFDTEMERCRTLIAALMPQSWLVKKRLHKGSHSDPTGLPAGETRDADGTLDGVAREKEREKERDIYSVLKDGGPSPLPDPASGGLPPFRSVLDPPPPLGLTEPAPAPAEHPASSDPSAAERDLFARGREVLGTNAGGQIAKLLKAKGSNVALARSAIETASTKHNAREYLARIIRGDDTGLPAGQLYDRSI